jgi:hypothetical protein
MKKFKLTVSGWSINASAHNVSNEIVDKINQHKFEMDVEDLTDLMGDLEEIVPGYSMFSTNMWVLERPTISEKVFLQILDEDLKLVEKFELSQIDDVMDTDDDTELEIEYFSIIPNGVDTQNVLYVQEDNKGLICSFDLLSDDVPEIEDFTFSTSYIETPEGDLEILDRIFWRGVELEMSYDMQEVSGKSIKVELIEFDEEY